MDISNLDLLTVKEVAEILDVSDMTVRTIILKGDLKSFKVCNKYKIPKAELEIYLESRIT